MLEFSDLHFVKKKLKKCIEDQIFKGPYKSSNTRNQPFKILEKYFNTLENKYISIKVKVFI